jgi:hypothetical protein
MQNPGSDAGVFVFEEKTLLRRHTDPFPIISECR